MKKLFSILLFSCVIFYFTGVTSCNDERGASSDIKGLIEKFINNLKTIIPEEFIFSDLNVTIPYFLEEYIMGCFYLSNISFSGLKEFEATIQYQPIIPIPKQYLITIEYLQWQVAYISDLIVSESKYLTVFGKGSSIVSFKGIQIAGAVSVSLLPMNADVTVDIDWDRIDVEVSGLLDDDIFSKEVSEYMGRAFTNISETFKKPLSYLCTNIANFIIKFFIPS